MEGGVEGGVRDFNFSDDSLTAEGRIDTDVNTILSSSRS